jgi:hypothetical protein
MIDDLTHHDIRVGGVIALEHHLVSTERAIGLEHHLVSREIAIAEAIRQENHAIEQALAGRSGSRADTTIELEMTLKILKIIDQLSQLNRAQEDALSILRNI